MHTSGIRHYLTGSRSWQPEGVSLGGVVDVRLDPISSKRRWTVARTLGIFVVVALAGGVLAVMVEWRTKSADPPYFAPSWLPARLSLDRSAVVVTSMSGFRAEVDYGHEDGQGGLDRYLQLVRTDESPVDHPESPEYAALSLIGTRDGRSVWRRDGATGDGFFFGYVQTPDCGVAAVSSKGVVDVQVIHRGRGVLFR